MVPTLSQRSGRSSWISPFDVFDRDFERLFKRWNADDENGGLLGAYPVDVREDDDHLYVDAEMPGFKKDEISVTLENGVLHIGAERRQEKAKGETHLNERRFHRVSRSFSLPTTVDESKVDARLSDGVLHLTLNKREEVKPRKIEVK